MEEEEVTNTAPDDLRDTDGAWPAVMHKAVTISAERARIGLQATYELEGLLELLVRLANAESSGGAHADCDVLRGMAIRAKSLARVLMCIVGGDVNEASAHLTVFGELQP